MTGIFSFFARRLRLAALPRAMAGGAAETTVGSALQPEKPRKPPAGRCVTHTFHVPGGSAIAARCTGSTEPATVAPVAGRVAMIAPTAGERDRSATNVCPPSCSTSKLDSGSLPSVSKVHVRSHTRPAMPSTVARTVTVYGVPAWSGWTGMISPPVGR